MLLNLLPSTHAEPICINYAPYVKDHNPFLIRKGVLNLATVGMRYSYSYERCAWYEYAMSVLSFTSGTRKGSGQNYPNNHNFKNSTGSGLIFALLVKINTTKLN